MRLYKTALGLLVSFVIFQICCSIAPAQVPSADETKNVTAVRVKNNKTISAETILSKIRTKTGDRFSQEILNEDLKKLYATQYFTDVSIDVEDFEGGIAVTFIVEEKPVIEDIVFKGNKAFRPQKLKATMKSKANEMLNLALVAQDVSEIKAMYIKRGYPLADVKYTIDLNKDTNKAIVTVTVDENKKVKVANVDIIGNKVVKTAVIRKELGTKKAWFFGTGVFREDVLQEDVEKVKALYDDIGYLDAVVTPKLDYTEGGTVLKVVIEISEGKQYLVGDVTIKGNLVLPEKDVWAKIKMRKAKPFSTRALREDSMAVRQLYYDHGYMNVIVDIDRSVNKDTGNIDINYYIDPKEVVYVGKVEIQGNLKTKDVVIRRELKIYPGEKYNGSKMRRSKERIYNLGYFENVSFDTVPTEVPNVQNLVVTVKETKTGEFSFGGGYSSIDMLVGFAEINQRNFDILNWPYFTGGGQNLSIKAEIGMVRNNYNLSWTEPWIFGYPYLFGFDVYRTQHDRNSDVGWAYDETRLGGDVRLGKEITDTIRADLTYRLEDVKLTNFVDNASVDFTKENGSNIVSSLALDVTMDTRDNVFNPSRGFILGGSIEDAGGVFMGDKNYVKGTAQAVYYHTFYEKFVLELKGRAGLSGAYGKTDEVPVYERFYAGGANTIRGYKERRVGPRDPGSNEPIGGEGLILGNVELTFPVYEKILKGAVFYDVGQVWRHKKDFIAGGNYKSGAGVGVRVKTPIGPVKVDYGYPLSSNYEDDKTGEFYFSMSRGF